MSWKDKPNLNRWGKPDSMEKPEDVPKPNDKSIEPGPFNKAFSNARKLGNKTFVWNGKTYGTDLAKAPDLEPKKPTSPAVDETSQNAKPPEKPKDKSAVLYPSFPKDSPEAKDFRGAFTKARKDQGEDGSFEWQGRKYGTKLKENKKAESQEKPAITVSKTETPKTESNAEANKPADTSKAVSRSESKYPVYKKDSEEAKDFRANFAKARKEQGEGGTFEWQGRKYSTKLKENKKEEE